MYMYYIYAKYVNKTTPSICIDGQGKPVQGKFVKKIIIVRKSYKISLGLIYPLCQKLVSDFI